MKLISLLVLSVICSSTVIAQDLWYELRKSNAKPVSQSTLNEAGLLKDLNPGYPSSWIAESDYISTAISITQEGKVVTLSGINEEITTEQKAILKKADIGTDIEVSVKYISNAKEKEMNFALTVAPHLEASYIGGQAMMEAYIQKNAIDQISNLELFKTQSATINFEIDEMGQPVIKEISKSSTDQSIDQLLIEVIENMPTWQPAADLNGKKVKQQFVLVVGSQQC